MEIDNNKYVAGEEFEMSKKEIDTLRQFLNVEMITDFEFYALDLDTVNGDNIVKDDKPHTITCLKVHADEDDDKNPVLIATYKYNKILFHCILCPTVGLIRQKDGRSKQMYNSDIAFYKNIVEEIDWI